MLEQAARDALRGRLEDAQRKIAEGAESAGQESTQASAGIAATKALTSLAAGDMDGAERAAQGAWTDPDAVGLAAPVVAAAAVAANRPDWAQEARLAYEELDYRGHQVTGMRHSLAAAVALLERRWVDARSEYLVSRRDLTSAGALFDVALLDLAIGSRGAGHFPEAEQAAAAARDFFTSRGAVSFLERYAAAFVPSDDDARLDVKDRVASPPAEVRGA